MRGIGSGRILLNCNLQVTTRVGEIASDAKLRGAPQTAAMKSGITAAAYQDVNCEVVPANPARSASSQPSTNMPGSCSISIYITERLSSPTVLPGALFPSFPPLQFAPQRGRSPVRAPLCRSRRCLPPAPFLYQHLLLQRRPGSFSRLSCPV